MLSTFLNVFGYSLRKIEILHVIYMIKFVLNEYKLLNNVQF